MRRYFTAALLCATLALTAGGCKNSSTDNIPANKRPTTRLWLMPNPDSTIAAGKSRQLIHWSGDDADGVVRGFLIASGHVVSDPRHPVFTDAIKWEWTAVQESLVAFPLLTALDTFQVAVRAVDNSFTGTIPEHAVLRSVAGVFFVDANANGIFDSADVWLSTLAAASDVKGAVLDFPTYNQAPSVEFFNPFDSTVVPTQPDTTFTAASFSWRASDPDGDETVASYELALNDSNDVSRRLSVPSNVKLATLLVPRDRGAGVVSVTEVDADVWSGSFSGNRRLVGTLPHLKLNSRNVFYIRARDVAGAYSGFIKMGDAGNGWYVKNPLSRVLLVNDYISADKAAALDFYRSTLTSLPGNLFPTVDILDIGLGLGAADKQITDSHTQVLGKLVPKLINPALIYTMQLFDLVVWYTDGAPSLTAARYPLYQYLHDASHPGKVIFSTMFLTAADPSGALTDFAPLDSVSSVGLGNSRRYPTMGETQIPAGFRLNPLSSGLPSIQFNNTRTTHVAYMRQVYRRPDASYVYAIQKDSRTPLRYAAVTQLNDLSGVAAIGSQVWSCGGGGSILHSNDGGATWSGQNSTSDATLRCISFLDANNGWAVGDAGALLSTSDGGSTWNLHPGVSFENLTSVRFFNSSFGFTTGSNGTLLRTSDGGANWSTLQTGRAATMRGTAFASTSVGVAVGDSGLMYRTTNGGLGWSSLPRITAKHLRTVLLASANHFIVAGDGGTHLESHDGGATWSSAEQFKAPAGKPQGNNLHIYSMVKADSLNFWAVGSNGVICHSSDGGLTWPAPAGLVSGFEQTGTGSLPEGTGQLLNGVAIAGANGLVAVGTGGVAVRSIDGGNTWKLTPDVDINVAVLDGVGNDGTHSFFFIGLPLHLLNGDVAASSQLFKYVITTEFGL